MCVCDVTTLQEYIERLMNYLFKFYELKNCLFGGKTL